MQKNQRSNCQHSLDHEGLLRWFKWERIHLQCWRPGFNTWVVKILWRRAWQLTPVFLPEQSMDRGDGWGPWGHKESDMPEWLHTAQHWITEKERQVQKNIYFCFIGCTKAFDSVDHYRLLKILNKIRIPVHLTCLLRNLYTDQEATVRTRHGKMDWLKIGKGICQGCILSPCLFNFSAGYIHHVECWAGWLKS